MAQSQNINYYLGSVKVKHFIDTNNARLTNVGNPVADTDAATKLYVDTNVLTSGIEAGTGINRVGSTFNVSNNLTHVTAIGNINIGSWSANTINVQYGGTGKSNFTANKLVMGDGTNPLVSLSELAFESNVFKSTCPIYISNTTNSTGLGSGGSFTTLGGASVAGKVFIGNDLVVSNNTYIQGDMTVGNVTINGSSNFGSATFSNSTVTNITCSNILTTKLTSTNITSTNIISNNITSNNIISSSITNENLLTSNISTTTLISNNINTNNFITTNISASSFIVTPNILSTNTTTSNLVLTNLTGSSAILSNLNILSSVTSPSIVSSSIASVNINSTNLSVSSITSNNLIVNTSTILNNVTNSNLFVNNITASNLRITNISNTNTTTSNLVATSINTSNFTSSNVRSTNATMSNLLTTNVTTNNLSSNNLISTNISTGFLSVSGTSIFTTMHSSNISTGQIHISNIGIINNASIINITSSNLFNTNSTISNIYNANLTTSNLYVNNTTTLATVASMNLSTGNLHSAKTAFLNNEIVNTSTIGNLTVTNISLLGTFNSDNISASNISVSANLIVPFVNNTTQTTTNLLSTNVKSTNISSSTLQISGISILGTVNSNNLSTGTLFVSTRSNLTNVIATNVTVSSIQNTHITTSNIIITNNANINKKLTVGSNFSSTPSTTSGNIFNVAPCTFTDITTSASGVLPFWTTNFFGSTTLSAQNNITTEKTCSIYLQGDPVLGVNQSRTNSAALTIGYVNNQTGGNMTGQIMLERNDGNWYGSIFTEQSSNRIVIANASLSGGGGIGLYTYTGTKISFADITGPSNFTPTTFLDFSNTTSQFYSTLDSTSKSTGSVVIDGGLGVVKTITCDTIIPQTIDASITSLQDVDSSIIPTIGQSLVWNGSFWSPYTITGGGGVSTGPISIEVYPMELVMPIMDSNGPVSGTDGDYYVTSSSENNSTYAAYKCLSSIKNPSDWATDGENTNFWITVQLPTSQNVRYVLLEGRLNNEDPNYITVQGSNDNSTFTDIIGNEYFTALNYDGYFAARIPESSISYTYYKFLFANGSGPNPGLNMIRLFKYDNSTYTEGIMDNSSFEGNGIFNSAIVNGRWPMAFELTDSGVVNIRAQFTCYTTSSYVYRKFAMYIDGAPFSNSGSAFIKQMIHQNLHMTTQTLEWTGNLTAGVHTLSFFVDGGTGIVFDTNDTIQVNVIKY